MMVQDEAGTYKERATNALKGSAKETKEDTFLILTGTMMIIVSMMLKGTVLPVRLLGNSILAEDVMCVIILEGVFKLKQSKREWRQAE